MADSSVYPSLLNASYFGLSSESELNQYYVDYYLALYTLIWSGWHDISDFAQRSNVPIAEKPKELFLDIKKQHEEFCRETNLPVYFKRVDNLVMGSNVLYLVDFVCAATQNSKKKNVQINRVTFLEFSSLLNDYLNSPVSPQSKEDPLRDV